MSAHITAEELERIEATADECPMPWHGFGPVEAKRLVAYIRHLRVQVAFLYEAAQGKRVGVGDWQDAGTEANLIRAEARAAKEGE
jgi:hypothetical protein